MRAPNLQELFDAQFPKAKIQLSLTSNNRLCIDYTAPSSLKDEIEVFVEGLRLARPPRRVKYHGKGDTAHAK